MTHQAGYTHYPEPKESLGVEQVNDENHRLLCKVYECKQDIFTGILRVLENKGFTREYVESELNEKQVHDFENNILAMKDNLDDMFHDLIKALEDGVMYRAQYTDANEYSLKAEMEQMGQECSKFMKDAYHVRRGEL